MMIESGPHPATAYHTEIDSVEGLLPEADAVGRCTGPSARLRVRVTEPVGERFRVRLRLAWDERTTGNRTARAVPRLVPVAAQGVVRAASVLTAPRPRAPRVCGQVAFELRSRDLSDDGLLVLELSGSLDAGVPQRAPGGPVLTSAATGLVVCSVGVEACDRDEEPIAPRSYERLGILAMGGLGEHEHDKAGPYRLRADLLVVNPVRPEALRLRVRPAGRQLDTGPRPAAPLLPAPRRTRLRVPEFGRLLVERTADGLPVPLPELRPHAVGLAGAGDVPLRTHRGQTYWELIVPACAEPVLVTFPVTASSPGGYRLMSCVPEPLGS